MEAPGIAKGFDLFKYHTAMIKLLRIPSMLTLYPT